MNTAICLTVISVLLLPGSFQDHDKSPVVFIDHDLLEHTADVILFNKEGWLYHPGDDPALATDSTFSGLWTPVSLGMFPENI